MAPRRRPPLATRKHRPSRALAAGAGAQSSAPKTLRKTRLYAGRCHLVGHRERHLFAERVCESGPLVSSPALTMCEISAAIV